MRELFENATACVLAGKLDDGAQNRLEIFINNLLADYPLHAQLGA